MRTILVSLVLALGWMSAPVGGQNLVPSGEFDTDVSGWITTVNGDAFWDTDDERGSGGSGSLRAETTSEHTTLTVFSPCTPVTAGTVYTFGGSLRVPEALAATGFVARARLRFTSSPTCNSSLGSSNGDSTVGIAESWGPAHGVAQAPEGAVRALLMFNVRIGGDPTHIEFFLDNAFLFADQTCAETTTTLCLNNNRFRVWAEWERPNGTQGFGRVQALTKDSGYLWFFNDTNIELVTKILDGCAGTTNHFWTFVAGLTNVGVTLQVRDTLAGETRTYENPLGQAYSPIQDTAAFDTCP